MLAELLKLKRFVERWKIFKLFSSYAISCFRRPEGQRNQCLMRTIERQQWAHSHLGQFLLSKFWPSSYNFEMDWLITTRNIWWAHASTKKTRIHCQYVRCLNRYLSRNLEDESWACQRTGRRHNVQHLANVEKNQKHLSKYVCWLLQCYINISRWAYNGKDFRLKDVDSLSALQRYLLFPKSKVYNDN